MDIMVGTLVACLPHGVAQWAVGKVIACDFVEADTKDGLEYFSYCVEIVLIPGDEGLGDCIDFRQQDLWPLVASHPDDQPVEDFLPGMIANCNWQIENFKTILKFLEGLMVPK